MIVYRPKTKKINTAGETNKKPLLFFSLCQTVGRGFEIVGTSAIEILDLRLLYEASHGRLLQNNRPCEAECQST
jgi:hypothetical protein